MSTTPEVSAVTATAQCGVCHCPVTLFQPDPQVPERLLGVCPECRTWSLLDGDRHLAQAVSWPEARPAGRAGTSGPARP
jgi:hypothetical protein